MGRLTDRFGIRRLTGCDALAACAGDRRRIDAMIRLFIENLFVQHCGGFRLYINFEFKFDCVANFFELTRIIVDLYADIIAIRFAGGTQCAELFSIMIPGMEKD